MIKQILVPLDDSELAGPQDDPDRQYRVLAGGEPVDG